MATVLEHHKFVFVSNNLNSNKVWEVILHSNNDVEVRYGRIRDGHGLQSKTHYGAGRKKMDALIREKTKPSDHYDGGCYREIEVLDTGSAAPVTAARAGKSELKEIAKKQVATCPVTQKLIEFFTDVNAHDIYQATGGRIQYDVSAGTFRTPVGIVTRTNVDEARKLLDKIAQLVGSGKFDKPFITTLEDYLMLIPQDVGHKFNPRAFCGDTTAVQKQSAILDGLDASIAAVVAGKDKKDKKSKTVQEEAPPNLFQVKLTVVDGDDIANIQKFYEKTRHRGHKSYNLKMKKVYAIDMPLMKAA